MGTWTTWRNRLTRASWGSARRRAESCTWEGTTGINTCWGHPTRKELCRKIFEDSGKHQVEHKLTVRPWGKVDQWPPRPLDKVFLAVEGGNLVPVLSNHEGISGLLCPSLSIPEERHGHAGVSPAKGHKMIKSSSPMRSTSELGLFTLERRIPKEDLLPI